MVQHASFKAMCHSDNVNNQFWFNRARKVWHKDWKCVLCIKHEIKQQQMPMSIHWCTTSGDVWLLICLHISCFLLFSWLSLCTEIVHYIQKPGHLSPKVTSVTYISNSRMLQAEINFGSINKSINIDISIHKILTIPIPNYHYLIMVAVKKSNLLI